MYIPEYQLHLCSCSPQETSTEKEHFPPSSRALRLKYFLRSKHIHQKEQSYSWWYRLQSLFQHSPCSPSSHSLVLLCWRVFWQKWSTSCMGYGNSCSMGVKILWNPQENAKCILILTKHKLHTTAEEPRISNYYWTYGKTNLPWVFRSCTETLG